MQVAGPGARIWLLRIAVSRDPVGAHHHRVSREVLAEALDLARWQVEHERACRRHQHAQDQRHPPRLHPPCRLPWGEP